MKSSPSLFGVLVLLGTYMAGQLAAYCWILSINNHDETAPSDVVSIAFFRGHAVEWLVVILLAVWLTDRPRRLPDVLFCLLLFGFLTIQTTQFLAFYFTRQFLTTDALQNAMHIGLLVSPFSVCVALLPALLTLMTAALLARMGRPHVGFKTRVLLTCGIVAVGLLVVTPELTGTEDDSFAHGSSPGGLPATELVGLLFGKDHLPGPGLAPGDDEIARDLGFFVDPTSQYPFIKEWIHDGTTPFPRLRDGDRPNLIVFFVESLSARKLSIYGSPYTGITPSIDEFARHGMVVDNYFSHTAATYRGLRGQLCSIFPFHGGVGGWFEPDFKPPKTRLLGLPTLLDQRGYDTVLFGANTAAKARMDFQAAAVGFSRSLLRDQILGEILDGEQPLGPHVSDHQMMRALWKTIETGRIEQPFFAFVYNVGTHTNLDSKFDGVIYGDGLNNVLNTTHTFDHAFGEFWRQFTSSPLATNTIVILTADHPHFPTPAFIEVAGPDYQKVFFDRIPLVIYHPTLKLPQRFDPGVTTSLDFAPSVAHLMELPNQRNHFLGRSIFEQDRNAEQKIQLGQYGQTLCVVRPDGRMTTSSMRAEHRPHIAGLVRFIEYSQYIELSDRLWDGGGGR